MFVPPSHLINYPTCPSSNKQINKNREPKPSVTGTCSPINDIRECAGFMHGAKNDLSGLHCNNDYIGGEPDVLPLCCPQNCNSQLAVCNNSDDDSLRSWSLFCIERRQTVTPFSSVARTLFIPICHCRARNFSEVAQTTRFDDWWRQRQQCNK